MTNTRPRMCFRGCACGQCSALREKDRAYSKARTGDPLEYPSQRSIYRRAVRFGLTVEQLQEMERERDNRCDVCGEQERVKGSTGKVKSLAVDHCHASGLIRGLLCNNCNRALGLLGHSAELLERAAAYLRAANQEGT